MAGDGVVVSGGGVSSRGELVMKRMLFSVTLVLVMSLSGCMGLKTVQVDQNYETIPREVAVDFLKKQSVKLAELDGCIYSNRGVFGVPYTELSYEAIEQSALLGGGVVALYINNKGTTNSLCAAAAYNIWREDVTGEEFAAMVDKTVSALRSLGVTALE